MGATELREPEVQEETAVSTPQAASNQASPLSLPPLFSTSLLEYAGTEKRRRSGATLISFILQCFIIAVGLIIPLMFTEALPTGQLLGAIMLAPPPPPPPPPPAAAVKIVRQIQSDVLNSGQLRTPSRIPQKVEMIRRRGNTAAGALPLEE